MQDFHQALSAAFEMVERRDPELLAIVLLSLRVSMTATIIAMLVGTPIGAFLAMVRFPGREGIVVLANALLGLPPVVVGLAVYLILSRSGPLGFVGWLFTPAAMIVAQVLLASPIVVALVHRLIDGLWNEYGLRPGHIRGRRDHRRGRKHPRRDPHHDHRHRA
jgi:tungstate transport system permease protein